MGRFLSEDPIGFRGGDTNLYRYVGNNPVIFNDPRGEAANYITPAAVGLGIGGLMIYLDYKKKSEKKYTPGQYPSVDPPHPNPDNTDSREEQLQKKKENQEFKDRLCQKGGGNQI